MVAGPIKYENLALFVVEDDTNNRQLVFIFLAFELPHTQFPLRISIESFSVLRLDSFQYH